MATNLPPSTGPPRPPIRLARSSRSSPWQPRWKAASSRPKTPWTASITIDVGGVTLDDWTWMDCDDQMQAERQRHLPLLASQRPADPAAGPDALLRPVVLSHRLFAVANEQAGAVEKNLLSDMARAFGLGKATGIEQIAESEGTSPTPPTAWMPPASPSARGQVLVTPLQVAALSPRWATAARSTARNWSNRSSRSAATPSSDLQAGGQRHPACQPGQPEDHPGRHDRSGQ